MNNLIQIFSSGDTGIQISILMIFTSFLGGVLASLSPCSLAMLPLIIGYVGGYSKETPLRTLVQLCCFILGTAIVFTIIGIICAITGGVFANAFGAYFTIVIASLLLIMGLQLIGLIAIDMPVIIKSIPQNKTNSLVLYPLLLGMLFALAGTPCSTPILAGIMAFAAIGKNILTAVLMLFAFALGQGLILILAGFFTAGIKNIRKFANATNMLIKFSGLLLIAASAYLFVKIFAPLI